MQRPSLVIGLSVALSALASVAIVTLLQPTAALPMPVAAETSSSPVGRANATELGVLERKLDDLAMEVALLREQSSGGRSEARPPDSGGEVELPTWLASMQSGAGRDDPFKAKVVEVLTQIEEEREAQRWDEELANRQVEATKANEEYDTLAAELDTRLAGMRDALRLDSRQARDLRSLIATQNDRNREMTGLWSEGATSNEEIGRIFNENRVAHRAEVMALLGRDQEGLGVYRKLVGNGALGGRFAFFIGPREDWGVGESNGGK